MAGRKWLKGFLKCHPKITLKIAKNLSITHVMGANEMVISNLFNLLQDIKNKFGILSPCQIWSRDETGIQNIPKEVKVLGSKKIRIFQQVSREQGEMATMLMFVNAAGQSVPPLIIHKGQCVQDTQQLKAPGNMKLAATERGYITKSKFHEYGLHFVKFLKAHGLAEVLDSVPFVQFKKSWESYLRKYNTNHSGRVLNKVNFWDVFVPPGILQSLLSILSWVLRKHGSIPMILRSSLQNP